MIGELILLKVGKEDGVKGGEERRARVDCPIQNSLPNLAFSFVSICLLYGVSWEALTVRPACSAIAALSRFLYSSIVFMFLRIPSARNCVCGRLWPGQKVCKHARVWREHTRLW